MPSISDILGAAKSSVAGGVSSSISQLVQGDVSGALSSLTSTATDLVANTLAQSGASFGDAMTGMNAREDAMQSWCWYAILPVIQNTSANLVSLNPSVTLPWYYVEESNLPMRSVTPRSLDRNGHTANYAESYSVEGLSLTFFMDNANLAYKYLKAWQGNMLGNADPGKQVNQGVWGYPANYKKDITIVVTSVTKKTLITAKYYGCMPTNLAALDLDSDSSTRLKQRVEFAVDDMDLKVSNLKGNLENLVSTASGYAISALNGVSSSFLSGLSK
jgi:hypothetical protein